MVTIIEIDLNKSILSQDILIAVKVGIVLVILPILALIVN